MLAPHRKHGAPPWKPASPHYTQIASTDFERMSGIENLTVGSKPVYNVRFLAVNLQQPFLQDERVRQAIAHAIDRAEICAQILTYMSEPLDELAPLGFWVNEDVPAYPFDPEKAKALLAEAGWDPAQELQMSFYYADQAHMDAFSIIQQQLIDVGINATVFQVDPATIAEFYYEEGAPFHIMLGGLRHGARHGRVQQPAVQRRPLAERDKMPPITPMPTSTPSSPRDARKPIETPARRSTTSCRSSPRPSCRSSPSTT